MRTRKRKPQIALILTLSLVWLILSADAVALAASDWFVRPAGGNYGSEDGSSYQDAWDGLSNVVWGGAGVVAGDNLYVCGLHLWPQTPRPSADRNWVIGANGTGEDTRITIRGDYSGDQGIIWGVQNLSGAGTVWVDEGGNTYSSTSENYRGFFFEDVTATSWNILTKVDSIQECKDTPGSRYSPTYKYPDPLYVHCSDGGDPTGRIVAGANGWYIWLTDCEYITFKNIEFYVPKFEPDTDLAYIRWEGCKLWYRALFFRDGCHHIEFIDCDRAYGIGGFGFQDYYAPHGVDTPHHITIRGCYIHDIGSIYGQNPDAEGIGVNGADDLTIENNEFYNCGSAITTYPYTEQTSKNLIIRWNYIHDMHQIASARGVGIELNMNPPNTQDKSGGQVYGNIVANVPGVAYRSTWATDQIVFYNNVAYNCGTSFYFNHTYQKDTGPNIKLRNNISLYPQGLHIYFGSDTTESNYTIDSNYNLFYPDASGSFAFKESGYATYPDLSGWQALSKSGCTFDPNSIVADPLFVDPGNFNFHVWSDSPAINAGVDVGLTLDFEGNPTPQGPAPDIGAYECVSDPNNPTPELQSIGNKSVNENVTLTFDVNATDPNGEPITYSVQSLPSGSTFVGQTFSWTPSYDQAGSYQVRFIASDGNSNDSETITITVNNVNRAPVFAAISDQSIDENSTLGFSVSAADPDGDNVTYSVNSLPSGAAFASQTFTWTPSYSQAGSHDVTFIATDGQDQDSETITITVNNVNRATDISLIPNALIKYVSGTMTTAEIELGQDPDGDPLTYTYSGWLTSLPYTITFDDVGTHTLHVDVSDGTDTTGKDITITVDVDNQVPNVTNCKPAEDSIQNGIDTLITLNIVDTGIGVDASSVIIKVNNGIVYTGDTDDYNSTYGYCERTGMKADYMFHYTHDVFNYDQTVTVTVNATDLAGNVMDEYSYSFQTNMRSFGDNKKINSDTLSSNGMPVTVRDSSGNIWAAWHAGTTGSRDICIGKLTVEAESFSNIIKVRDNSTDQCNPAIAVDSDDKLYVAWQDNRRGNWDIYISTSNDGTNWSTETRVTDSNDNQINPAIVVDSSNNAYIVWEDDRNGNDNQDIYVATSNNDFVTKTIAQITSDSSNQVEPAIAADSANTIYVVWTDTRNSKNDIYGAASNNGPWTNIPIVNTGDSQSSPAIAAEAVGSILHLVWVDDRPGDDDIYYAQTGGGLPGSPLTGSSIIDDPGEDQLNPVVAVSGSTGNNLQVFACWQDERDADDDLYLVEISSGSGTNVFVGDDNTNSGQDDPAIGIDGDGHPYLVWTDSRNTNTDIYYAGSTFVESTALASNNISTSSTVTVGTPLNTIDSVDDVSVVVPAGAYPCDIEIIISKITNPLAFAMQCLGAYDFGPSGIEFSQPVTVTIPYNYTGSEDVALAYWYNSLTDALSQQGITDVETIVVSSSLHALRFKTTHFTPFYIFLVSAGAAASGGGGGGGCSMSPDSQASVVELLLPYIGLTVTMVLLKLRDRRKSKARNITKSGC